VEIDDSHHFRLEHWGYLVETDLFWNGFGNGYEATSLQIWSRLAPHARVIVDVGANTGIYTLVARCLNPGATVVALEPVERVFRRLQRNIELNGYNVTLEKLAASDTTGTAVLYDLPSEHEYTASLDWSMLKNSGDVVKYTVTTSRLDDALSSANLRGVDLVKIDVEQAEPQVLRGMGRFLSDCKPTLLVEILNPAIARDVMELTRNLGYNIFRVVEQHGLVRATQIEATEFEERNYLLVQDKSLEAAKLCDFVLQ
jgi:FkbM family methyltransferase